MLNLKLNVLQRVVLVIAAYNIFTDISWVVKQINLCSIDDATGRYLYYQTAKNLVVTFILCLAAHGLVFKGAKAQPKPEDKN